MKKIVYLLSFSLICFSVAAQDEGLLTKQSRIALSNGVFVGIGPSFTFGKNIGDYSTGFNAEAGYMKRLNRVLSIGPSLSYSSFKYDPKETGDNNMFFDSPSNETFDPDYYRYYIAGMYIDFKGGDMSLLSAAVNIKLNLIPIMDDTKVSVYAFAKPFITSVTRKEVKGTAYIYRVYDINNDEVYTEDEAVTSIQETGYVIDVPWVAGDPNWASQGIDISDDLKSDTRITGGIFVGPGVEFMPTKSVSFYAQALLGYTFPVSFISTEGYKGNDLNAVDEKYPMTEKGFPSLNLQFGVSFNF